MCTSPALEVACDQKRKDMINYAMKLCIEGAHYLWGGDGSKPTPGGSVQLKPDDLNIASTGLGFCAAMCNQNVCAGRFRHADLILREPKAAARVENMDLGGSDKLKDFVATYKDKASSQVGWDDKLTPRRLCGYTGGDKIGAPMDYMSSYVDATGKQHWGIDVTDKLVWGEGCDDTQHFDCYHFVSYVLKEFCKSVLDGRALQEGEVVKPGDVLYYTGHVAFAGLDNKDLLYPSPLVPAPPGSTDKPKPGRFAMPSTGFQLVQAESAVFGCTCDKRNTHLPVRGVRLSAKALGIGG